MMTVMQRTRMEENQRRHRKVSAACRCRGRNDRLTGLKVADVASRRTENGNHCGPNAILYRTDPDNQDRSEGVERHEGGVDRPLLLDDAAVENCSAPRCFAGRRRLRASCQHYCQLSAIVVMVRVP